jgi:hypothetical protein
VAVLVHNGQRAALCTPRRGQCEAGLEGCGNAGRRRSGGLAQGARAATNLAGWGWAAGSPGCLQAHP